MISYNLDRNLLVNVATIWTDTFWPMLSQFGQSPSGQLCYSYLLVNVATILTDAFWPMLLHFGQLPSGQCCHNMDIYLLVNILTIWTDTFWSMCHNLDRYLLVNFATFRTDTYLLINFATILSDTFWSMLSQFGQLPSGQCCHCYSCRRVQRPPWPAGPGHRPWPPSCSLPPPSLVKVY